MRSLWFDPPSGWLYGFPKRYSIEDIELFNIEAALAETNYPKEDYELAKRYSRYWYDNE